MCGGQRLSLGLFFHWTHSLPVWLVWLASLPCGFHLCFSSVRITSWIVISTLYLHGCSGFELCLSCLHGKCFTYWTISSVCLLYLPAVEMPLCKCHYKRRQHSKYSPTLLWAPFLMAICCVREVLVYRTLFVLDLECYFTNTSRVEPWHELTRAKRIHFRIWVFRRWFFIPSDPVQFVKASDTEEQTFRTSFILIRRIVPLSGF